MRMVSLNQFVEISESVDIMSSAKICLKNKNKRFRCFFRFHTLPRFTCFCLTNSLLINDECWCWCCGWYSFFSPFSAFVFVYVKTFLIIFTFRIQIVFYNTIDCLVLGLILLLCWFSLLFCNIDKSICLSNWSI